MKPPAKEPHSAEVEGEPEDKQRLRRSCQERIRSFQAKSLRGMWAFAAFLLISIGASNDFSFLPSLPAHMRTMLGDPPSANLISGLLVLYSFSAIILILSRMMSGGSPASGIAQVAYLAVFYGFYHLSGSLGDNFWAVLAAGITILGLESYHNRIWFTQLIREEQEKLRQLDGDDKFFGSEHDSHEE